MPPKRKIVKQKKEKYSFFCCDNCKDLTYRYIDFLYKSL